MNNLQAYFSGIPALLSWTSVKKQGYCL